MKKLLLSLILLSIRGIIPVALVLLMRNWLIAAIFTVLVITKLTIELVKE